MVLYSPTHLKCIFTSFLHLKGNANFDWLNKNGLAKPTSLQNHYHITFNFQRKLRLRRPLNKRAKMALDRSLEFLILP